MTEPQPPMAMSPETRNTVAAIASLVLVFVTQVAGCVMNEQQQENRRRIERAESDIQDIKGLMETQQKRPK